VAEQGLGITFFNTQAFESTNDKPISLVARLAPASPSLIVFLVVSITFITLNAPGHK
jgi:hypothetical protein